MSRRELISAERTKHIIAIRKVTAANVSLSKDTGWVHGLLSNKNLHATHSRTTLRFVVLDLPGQTVERVLALPAASPLLRPPSLSSGSPVHTQPLIVCYMQGANRTGICRRQPISFYLLVCERDISACQRRSRLSPVFQLAEFSGPRTVTRGCRGRGRGSIVTRDRGGFIFPVF